MPPDTSVGRISEHIHLGDLRDNSEQAVGTILYVRFGLEALENVDEERYGLAFCHWKVDQRKQLKIDGCIEMKEDRVISRVAFHNSLKLCVSHFFFSPKNSSPRLCVMPWDVRFVPSDRVWLCHESLLNSNATLFSSNLFIFSLRTSLMLFFISNSWKMNTTRSWSPISCNPLGAPAVTWEPRVVQMGPVELNVNLKVTRVTFTRTNSVAQKKA